MKGWHQLPEGVKEDAIAWHVRLTAGGAGDVDYEAFGDWMAADAAHVSAMDFVEHYAEWLHVLRRADDGALNLLIETSQSSRGAAVLKTSGWRRAASIAAAFALVMVGVTVITSPFHPAPVVYASNDALRVVTLEDGTKVTLAPGAQMDVALEIGARKVTSFKGVGYFHVAHDTSRPFTIAFGSGRITVVGTQFVVRNDDAAQSVAVTEGVVTVSAADKPHRLAVGDRLRVEGQEKTPIVDKVDPASVGKWRSGVLTLDGAPIADILGQLNTLYGDATFRAADEDLDRMTFSGVLQLSDAATVARRLSEILPVTVTQVGNSYELQGKTSREE